MRNLTTLFAVFLCAFLLAAMATAVTQSELNKNPKFYNPATANSRTLDWKYGFRVGGFYSFAHQNQFNHDLKDGAGYDFDAILNITTRVAFRFSVGKSGLSIANNDYRSYAPVKVVPGGYGPKPGTPPWPPNFALVYNNRQMDMTQFFILMQLNLVPKRYSTENFNVYLLTGVGLMHYRVTQKERILDTDTDILMDYSAKRTQNRGAIQFGLGMNMLVWRNLGFDASVQTIFNDKSAFEPDTWDSAPVPEYDSTIDIRLGLIAAF